MNRREFLSMSATAAAFAASHSSISAMSRLGEAPLHLEEVAAWSLQTAMAQKKLTSLAITQGYLSRIATIDKKINSVIEVNPDALAIAAEMDRERRAGKVRGAL